MEVFEAILSRKSIRAFRQQTISLDLIEKLLKAAMQAPSAGNQQPWHFVVVTERVQLDALADVLRYGQSLKVAPLGIVVCADLDLEKHRGWWVQDCSAATQNLLLAAHGLGLGAVWLGVYPREERVTSIRSVIGAPENVIPLCVVSIGYPAGEIKPNSLRFNKSRQHNNHW
jgi:nitroreductase